MTNPCTPPPGTAAGTWHFLMHSAGVTMQAHWSHGIWRPLDSDWGYTENRYGELGWRYVGPICQGQGAAAATRAAPEPPLPWLALDLERASAWAWANAVAREKLISHRATLKAATAALLVALNGGE